MINAPPAVPGLKIASRTSAVARKGRRAGTRVRITTQVSNAEDGARLCLALGDVDGTLRWIEAACAERRGWLTYLKVEPLLDPIRSDPRYRDLLRRMQLD